MVQYHIGLTLVDPARAHGLAPASPPLLVQILCKDIADGASVTARRRSVLLLQLLERRSPAFTGSRRAGSSIYTVSAGKSDANGAPPAVDPRTSHGSSLRPPRKMGAPVPRRRTLRLLRPAGHSFALRAKWARQGRAAERFAFFAPPGMAPPSASLRGSAFVYFRRFPPLRNLQQPALRALFCIHVGIEKYPPPPKISGPGEPSVPVPSLRLRPCSGGAADSLPLS